MSYERWLPSDDLDRLPVERDGVRLRAPKGWEARIRREVAKGGDNSFTVLHAATVPLPADRADYGGGVVETMRRFHAACPASITTITARSRPVTRGHTRGAAHPGRGRGVGKKSTWWASR